MSLARIAKSGYQILKREGLIQCILEGKSWAIRNLKGQIYRIGSGRVCPVCGFSGRKFMSSGRPPRQEAACQICNAKERHRLLWLYIENETRLLDGGNDVLYFAPRKQIAKNIADAGNNLTTTDLERDDVDIKADATQLPFNSQTFDTIICSHVLEHIPDDHAAISEMSRVLNPDGDAIIMVPKDKDLKQTHEDDSITSPEERRKKFGQWNHVRMYGRDFAERLSENGFNVSMETYINELNSEIVDKYIGKEYDGDIHHCTKTSN